MNAGVGTHCPPFGADLSSSPVLLQLRGQRSSGASKGELLGAWLCNQLAWGVGPTVIQPGQETAGGSRKKVAHDPLVPWSPSHRLYSPGKGHGSWRFLGTPNRAGLGQPLLKPDPPSPSTGHPAQPGEWQPRVEQSPGGLEFGQNTCQQAG